RREAARGRGRSPGRGPFGAPHGRAPSLPFRRGFANGRWPKPAPAGSCPGLRSLSVPALGLFAVCAGFAVATIKAALIAHPVLRYPAYSVSLAGFVTLREESQK